MLSFNSHIKTVLFSFQWISASTACPSSDTTPHRHCTSMCSCRCGSSGRSGWSDDIGCTTSHLCTSLHTWRLSARRCPGLERWTCLQDELSVNHLYTADRTLTRFTKLYCLFEQGKQWRTEVSSERTEPSSLVGEKNFTFSFARKI